MTMCGLLCCVQEGGHHIRRKSCVMKDVCESITKTNIYTRNNVINISGMIICVKLRTCVKIWVTIKPGNPETLKI